MRRLMLLTLLALVLPTAALANSSFFQLQIGPPLRWATLVVVVAAA